MSPFWSHGNKGFCECRQSIVSPACLRISHELDRGTDGPGVASSDHRGVPRSTAMLIVGHKTEAIYRRYAIVDEAMLREGAAKLARGEGADLGSNSGPSWGTLGTILGTVGAQADPAPT